MVREDLHFRLRIPDGLKAKISEAALENRRSMTAEIIDRLERSFTAPAVPGLTSEQTARLITAIVEQVLQALPDQASLPKPNNG